MFRKGDFMRAYFWGTRGSLPASTTAQEIQNKIVAAIRASRSHRLETDGDIGDFIRGKLPFAVRGGYGGNTSCVEIREQDAFVICDAGTGLRDFGNYALQSKQAKQNGLPLTCHIFISHLHWDHIQGFPFFTPAYIPGNDIHLYGCHPELKQALINQQNPPYFPVPLSAMKANISFHTLEPGKIYEVAGLSVKAIKQNHPGDSYGYSFLKDGKKIVYSTDAEHKRASEKEVEERIEFFGKADLLIFDAQYTLADAIGSKENWGHSNNLMAVELSIQSEVKHLCLYHSEHTYNDEALDQFLDDTRKYLKCHADNYRLRIDLAYDGLEIDV
jgi:phosphoribosyl 1,2-cyclic phosphodiesterase